MPKRPRGLTYEATAAGESHVLSTGESLLVRPRAILEGELHALSGEDPGGPRRPENGENAGAAETQATEDGSARRIETVPVADLWLDVQPRQIVPEEVLRRLIDEGHAQPAALLAQLQEIAAHDPYFSGVLDGLASLAETIKADGVLQPVLVACIGERLVVRDGHRRSLAALLAGETAVPALVLDEVSAAQALARQIILNVQRSDLTPAERAESYLRLAEVQMAELASQAGVEQEPALALLRATILGHETGSEDDVEQWRHASRAERDLVGLVRERVCATTGIGRTHYYRLMKLNRLTPDARAAGRALDERQLNPVARKVPPHKQVTAIAMIRDLGLTASGAERLAEIVQSGDEDALQRFLAHEARASQRGKRRVAISWETLLHALPDEDDMGRRFSALRAELQALPEEQRGVRLHSGSEQVSRAEEFLRQWRDILHLYGAADAAVGSPRHGTE